MNLHCKAWGTMAAIAISAAVLVSCGGEAKQDAKSRGAVRVQPPEQPNATACAATQLRTSESADDLVPPPGTYVYRTKGHRELIGEGGESRPLPKRTEYVITQARDFGNVRCFGVQRRYTEALADSATFAVRGGDVYLTLSEVQSGGQFTTVRPEPPALFLSGAETEWSGTFSGPTRASYRMEVIGRRKIKVGNRTLSAIGIETVFSFDGEVRGLERATRWLSERDNLVLSERVSQQRTFGLDETKLVYRAQLTSTGPQGGGSQ